MTLETLKDLTRIYNRYVLGGSEKQGTDLYLEMLEMAFENRDHFNTECDRMIAESNAAM